MLEAFLKETFGISRDTCKRLAGERNKSALFAYLANRNPEYVHNVNPA